MAMYPALSQSATNALGTSLSLTELQKALLQQRMGGVSGTPLASTATIAGGFGNTHIASGTEVIQEYGSVKDLKKENADALGRYMREKLNERRPG